jgi:hypothetical protein
MGDSKYSHFSESCYMMTLSVIKQARDMRTIVELPDQQIEALKAMSEQQGLSRAELMRRAVAEYLALHQNSATEAAFGLWKKHAKDGVDYQQGLRQEWDE